MFGSVVTHIGCATRQTVKYKRKHIVLLSNEMEVRLYSRIAICVVCFVLLKTKYVQTYYIRMYVHYFILAVGSWNHPWGDYSFLFQLHKQLRGATTLPDDERAYYIVLRNHVIICE